MNLLNWGAPTGDAEPCVTWPRMGALGALLLTTALYPAVGSASCVTTGNVVTCDGALPTGQAVTGGFDTININSLTQAVGGTGLRFTNTTGADINVNADLSTFGTVLDPGFGRTRRAGFEIRTDGAVTGTVTGDITGPTLSDVTNTPEFDLANFGTFNIFSGTGLDLTRTGDLIVTRPTVTATTSRRTNIFAPGGERDFVMGQFGAIRLRDDSGDVTFTNTGNVSLDGGQRTLVVDRSGDVGVNQRVFSTRFAQSSGQSTSSDHFGFYVEANGDIDITQTGDVTLTGGGVTASAETTGAIAATIARHSAGRGVFITDNDFGNVDQVTFADQTSLTINGNVTLSGGNVEALSQANDLPGGDPNTRATAQVDSAALIGVWVNKPSARTITINGDISVTNGMTTMTARATDDAGQASGLVAASGSGMTASGIETIGSGLIGDTNPQRLSLNITGDVNVTGGDAHAEIVGTGTSDVNELSDLPNGTPRDTLVLNRFGGSGASGLTLFTQELSYDLAGDVTAIGGNASGQVTGSDMTAYVGGGQASGVSIGATSGLNGTTFDMVEDSALTAHAGDASLTLDGTDLSGRVVGGTGNALSISLNAVGQSRYVQTGDIVTTGGNATGVASTGSDLTVTGGSATGMIVSGGFIPEDAPASSTTTFRTEGEMIVTGGNASLTGSGEAVGGTAIGIFSFSTAGDTPPQIEHAGVIRATGGAGTTRQGTATGIGISDFGFPGFSADGMTISNDANVLVTGEIYTQGTGVESATQSDLVAGSDGISLAMTGRTQLELDGALVDVQGTNSNGIALSSGMSETILRNGTSVQVTADGGAGIALGVSIRAFEIPSVVASNNFISIDETSAVTTTTGIGIQDDSRTRVAETDPDTEEVVVVDVDLGNETTVDIAGTLSSGSGIAMDLGGGSDTLIIRETASITGVSRLGGGDDQFLYQGFAVTDAVDGGEGYDRVALSVEAGNSARFDPASQIAHFTNFESIAKSGAGTLVVGGGSFANGPLDFEIMEGHGIVDADQASLNIRVGGGASFQTDNQVGDIVVSNMGLVTGTGTASGFANSGRFAPGNSIGTFTVNGDFAQDSAGQLDVEIAANGTSDLVDVSGSATLGGTLSIFGVGYPTGYPDTQSYTILTADGGIAGAFDTIIDNLPDVDVVAAYAANSVAVSYSMGTVTPDDPSTEMSDKSIHPNALQAGLVSADIFARTLRARGANAAQDDAKQSALRFSGAAFQDQAGLFGPDGASVWVSPFASRSDVDAAPPVPGYNADANGLAIGYDVTRPTATGFVRAGVALGYSSTDVSSGPDSADIDTRQIGAYYHMERDAWRFTTAATYGRQSHDITRVIPLTGSAPATARASADGSVFEIGADLSYNLAPRLGWDNAAQMRLAPVVSLRHTVVNRDGYTETGAGILNLTVGSERFDRTVLGVGMAFEQTIQTADGMTVIPSVSLMYEHAFGSDRSVVNSTIAGVTGASFQDSGAALGDSVIAIGAGLEIKVDDTFSFDMRYSGQFGDNADTHSASIGGVWRF
ncbi:autotransporter outer membrane beta-barrel domain-containing protein [uncultured Tateyamaria sp.]|uniref:autotransporter outer membrane beta-barrel domain-containing protein n=1 Tax=Tateyamaria sp. 1078 TaxID=3417464 RepID=UPI0026267B9B|nr:autotransporter outer membrane beta-barrel domain-containing protein [uncultured Tateyamaria sp.]